MNVETRAIPYGHLAMVNVSGVLNYVELQHVSQRILLACIGNAGMSAFLRIKLVMEHVQREGAAVEMTPVFFFKTVMGHVK